MKFLYFNGRSGSESDSRNQTVRDRRERGNVVQGLVSLRSEIGNDGHLKNCYLGMRVSYFYPDCTAATLSSADGSKQHTEWN